MDTDDKTTKDLTVDENGDINTGTKIEITDSKIESSEPEVNEISPPDVNPVDNPEGEDSVVVEKPQTEDESISPASDESATDSSTMESEGSTSESEEKKPVIENENIAQSILTQLDTPAQDVTAPDAVTPQTPSNPSTPEHRNNKKLAVIMTIFVTLLLAAAVVYVYVSAQDNTQETTQQQPVSNESTSPATPEDIDQAGAEVDQALNSVDDVQDFDESSITDESLGL
jgi:uncharacterized protein HemX